MAQAPSEGTDMAITIATYQTFVRYASSSTEVVIGRKKAGVAVAQDRNDVGRLPPWPPDS